MNHDVPSRRNLRSVAPQDFTNTAADAIAHHRATQCFLDADTETADEVRPGSLVRRGLARNRELRAEEHCELRARAALARAVHSFIFGAFQQTHGTRETLPRTFRIFRQA